MEPNDTREFDGAHVDAASDGVGQRPRRRGGRLVVVFVPLLVALVFGIGLWVYSESHPVVPGVSGCSWVRDTKSRIDCVADRAISIAREDGTTAAVRAVQQAASERANLATDCHLGLHPLGARDARDPSNDGPEVIADNWCTQGYAHGFMIERLSGDEIEGDRALDAMRDCVKPVGMSPMTCAHAVGHAIVRTTTNLADSASTCLEYERSASRPVVDAASEQASITRVAMFEDCLQGAFMEIAMRGIAPTDDEPDPCAQIDSDVQAACYDYLPVMVSLRGGELQDVARACERDIPKRWRAVCAAGYGAGAVKMEECDEFGDRALRRACRTAQKDAAADPNRRPDA